MNINYQFFDVNFNVILLYLMDVFLDLNISLVFVL